MSDSLKYATGALGTVSDVSGYRDEIERLIPVSAGRPISIAEPLIENVAAFEMEKHFEDFLVKNWKQTELAAEFDIYKDDEDDLAGLHYPTDTGPLDILAISKDKKRLLVVELKRGQASDAVVGQTLRYMGYVQEELLVDGQTVQGAIIALEDDQKLRWALSMVPNIQFYRYQISFKLVKG